MYDHVLGHVFFFLQNLNIGSHKNLKIWEKSKSWEKKLKECYEIENIIFQNVATVTKNKKDQWNWKISEIIVENNLYKNLL